MSYVLRKYAVAPTGPKRPPQLPVEWRPRNACRRVDPLDRCDPATALPTPLHGSVDVLASAPDEVRVESPADGAPAGHRAVR